MRQTQIRKQVEHSKNFLDTQPVSSRAKTQVTSLQISYLKEKGKAYNMVFITNEEQVLGRKPLKWPPKIGLALQLPISLSTAVRNTNHSQKEQRRRSLHSTDVLVRSFPTALLTIGVKMPRWQLAVCEERG